MSEEALKAYEDAHRLSEAGRLGEADVNRMFIKHHEALNRLFPNSVRHEEDPHLKDDGKIAHHYYLRVGRPMLAEKVKGSGRTVDVSGPSDYGRLHTVKGTLTPTIVANIEPANGVDEIVDARNLHYPGRSMSAVLITHPPGFGTSNKEPDFRGKIIEEAYRVLEPGGFVLFNGASIVDLEKMIDVGFGMDAESGCIDSWVAADEAIDSAGTQYSTPRMHMEVLLQK